MSKRFLKLIIFFLTRRVATCKPGKPGLTSFSETLALFFILACVADSRKHPCAHLKIIDMSGCSAGYFIQFLSFRKMKVQDRQNGPSKSFWAYQKNLAGYAPVNLAKKSVVISYIFKIDNYCHISIQLMFAKYDTSFFTNDQKVHSDLHHDSSSELTWISKINQTNSMII